MASSLRIVPFHEQRMKRFIDLIKANHRLVSTNVMTKKWGRKFSQNKILRLCFQAPLAIVLTLYFLGQYRKYRYLEKDENGSYGYYSYKPLPFEISMYRMLPLRSLSRFWGWINSIELPHLIRRPILKYYASAFGCDLSEAQVEDLTQYRNLSEFFRRELKPGIRPIQGNEDDVVSPSDGAILHMGYAKSGLLEQVKGMTYTLESFLGPISWKENKDDGSDYQQRLCVNGVDSNLSTDLYYCVIYLAPGDYHRFHSPINWNVKYRRHFPGKLFSVRPTFASWFPNLFSVNERVAYIGDWKYGFFAMVPVGATNVGSMKIYFDPDLRTNRALMRLTKDQYEDKPLDNVSLTKGDPFGEFNLGSTIVLIFEAPKNMKFNIQRSMKIRYGQIISQVP